MSWITVKKSLYRFREKDAKTLYTKLFSLLKKKWKIFFSENCYEKLCKKILQKVKDEFLN